MFCQKQKIKYFWKTLFQGNRMQNLGAAEKDRFLTKNDTPRFGKQGKSKNRGPNFFHCAPIAGMTAARCLNCDFDFEPTDSIGGDFHFCQDCWERECSRLWWSVIVALALPEDQDLMTEHDLPRIFNPDSVAENPKDVIGSRKPALHLVPQSANILEAIVFGLGADKYGGAYNWRVKPIRASIYLSAAMRHLAQWLDGQNDDPESGICHLAHARACLAILIDAQTTDSLIDDRPPTGKSAELIQKHTHVVSLTSPPQLR